MGMADAAERPSSRESPAALPRAAYAPGAEAVTSTQELVELLREMVAPLRDLHVYFRDPGDRGHGTYVSPYERNVDGAVKARYLAAAIWRSVGTRWGYAFFDEIPYLSIGTWTSALEPARVDTGAGVRAGVGATVCTLSPAGRSSRCPTARPRCPRARQ